MNQHEMLLINATSKDAALKKAKSIPGFTPGDPDSVMEFPANWFLVSGMASQPIGTIPGIKRLDFSKKSHYESCREQYGLDGVPDDKMEAAILSAKCREIGIDENSSEHELEMELRKRRIILERDLPADTDLPELIEADNIDFRQRYEQHSLRNTSIRAYPALRASIRQHLGLLQDAPGPDVVHALKCRLTARKLAVSYDLLLQDQQLYEAAVNALNCRSQADGLSMGLAIALSGCTFRKFITHFRAVITLLTVQLLASQGTRGLDRAVAQLRALASSQGKNGHAAAAPVTVTASIYRAIATAERRLAMADRLLNPNSNNQQNASHSQL